MFYTTMNVIFISHSQRVKDIKHSQPDILGATVDMSLYWLCHVLNRKANKVQFPVRVQDISPSKCPDQLWGPTQAPIQSIPEAISPGIWSYTFSPICFYGMVLNWYRDNCAFTQQQKLSTFFVPWTPWRVWQTLQTPSQKNGFKCIKLYIYTHTHTQMLPTCIIQWKANLEPEVSKNKCCNSPPQLHSTKFTGPRLSYRTLTIQKWWLVAYGTHKLSWKYEGDSISKLQIVIEKNRMEIMTYKQHLFFNTISI